MNGEASKNVAGAWLANSDRRIKKNIAPIGSALDNLNKVRLVSFEYTDEYLTEHESIGDRRYMNVIAQEFAEVFPEYVKGSGETVPGTDEEILQVDTYPLTIYSAAAIQELHGVVKQQETRIEELARRLAELEAGKRASSSLATAGIVCFGLGAMTVGGRALRRRSAKGDGR